MGVVILLVTSCHMNSEIQTLSVSVLVAFPSELRKKRFAFPVHTNWSYKAQEPALIPQESICIIIFQILLRAFLSFIGQSFLYTQFKIIHLVSLLSPPQ